MVFRATWRQVRSSRPHRQAQRPASLERTRIKCRSCCRLSKCCRCSSSSSINKGTITAAVEQDPTARILCCKECLLLRTGCPTAAGPCRARGTTRQRYSSTALGVAVEVAVLRGASSRPHRRRRCSNTPTTTGHSNNRSEIFVIAGSRKKSYYSSILMF